MREQIRKQVGITLAFFVILLCGIAIAATSPAYAEVDMSNATELSLGEQYNGTVAAGDDEYYNETFCFTTTNNDSFYRVHVINSTVDCSMDFELYNQNGILEWSYRSVGTHNENSASDKLEKNSKYYIYLDCNGRGASGKYIIWVEEIKDEAGDNSDKATSRALNKKYNGKINTSYDEDWYKFKATKSGKYTFTLWNPSDYSMHVYRYDGNVVYVEGYDYIGSKYYRTATFNLKKDETCYLAITSSVSGTDSAEYQFKLAAPAVAKPSKVIIKSVKAGEKNLVVKYKRAKRTTKYQIGVKQKGASKWKYYKTTKLSKKITKLKTDKKYSVKVRGIRKVGGKNYYGKWSTTKTVTIK